MPRLRIPTELHKTLSRLAQETGESLEALLEQAIELLDDELFYRSMRRAYSDPQAVDDAQREAQAWDAAITDGLRRCEE